MNRWHSASNQSPGCEVKIDMMGGWRLLTGNGEGSVEVSVIGLDKVSVLLTIVHDPSLLR